MSKWTNLIDVVFGQGSDTVDIPNADPGDGSINNDKGFGVKYSQAIKDGDANSGLAVKREFFNALFKKIYSAVQEIQTKTVTTVNGFAPDNTGNVAFQGYPTRASDDLANIQIGERAVISLFDKAGLVFTLPNEGQRFMIFSACFYRENSGVMHGLNQNAGSISNFADLPIGFTYPSGTKMHVPADYDTAALIRISFVRVS